MLNYSKVLALSVCSLSCAVAFAQSETEFSSLEERMTGREFTEAGLHKLSPEELASLNRWISHRSLAEYEHVTDISETNSLPSQPGVRTTPIDQMAREAFETRIVGKFNGSDGNARFTLENGMVWEQTDGRSFFVPEVENPPVVIKPGALGSWKLTVEGFNGAIRVKRIR